MGRREFSGFLLVLRARRHEFIDKVDEKKVYALDVPPHVHHPEDDEHDPSHREHEHDGDEAVYVARRVQLPEHSVPPVGHSPVRHDHGIPRISALQVGSDSDYQASARRDQARGAVAQALCDDHDAQETSGAASTFELPPHPGVRERARIFLETLGYVALGTY